jgi:multiple sugar transport system ATP-binding protein
MVEIRVEGVSKNYGSVEVLDQVSFVVDDGEFAVLLGPSGCGKTTLLRCVAGLEKADKGEVYLGEELVNDLSPMERDLAMVFQGFSLFPTMTARENIAFPLNVRRVGKQAVDERVNEVARTLGIEHLLDKSPKDFSGGEQQRVAIGRAIVREPKAFLMDEPLSNLDAPLRAQLRSELKRLQKDIGVTTLYVTHDQAEALALADKIGVLNRGTLLQYGSPSSVFQAPSTAFVARFVGDPQTNIINVSLEPSGQTGGNYVMRSEGLNLSLPEGVGAPVKKAAQTMRSQGAATEASFQVSIRPEDIELSTVRDRWREEHGQGGHDADADDVVQGTILLDEPLTLYRVVTVRLGDGAAVSPASTAPGVTRLSMMPRDASSTNLKVLVSKDSKLDPGRHVWLKFDPDKFRFFDRETGAALVA